MYCIIKGIILETWQSVINYNYVQIIRDLAGSLWKTMNLRSIKLFRYVGPTRIIYLAIKCNVHRLWRRKDLRMHWRLSDKTAK